MALKISTDLHKTTVPGLVQWYAVSYVQPGGDASGCFGVTGSVFLRTDSLPPAAFVDNTKVDIGEPWPDPATAAGLQRLMEIAERLALEEWERRYGGAK